VQRGFSNQITFNYQFKAGRGLISSSVIILAVFFLISTIVLKKPSNDRNWEVGFEKLPIITITDSHVTIHNVRDYRHEAGKTISSGYTDRVVDAEEIERAWFIVEPFSKWDGVAHTYFVFDIKDQDPLAVSVEARREKGEDYSAVKGAFNSYELIYIWGTEKDLTIRRVTVDNNKLYMYPLRISKVGIQKLFLQLAEQSHALEQTSRFYNTLTSNCTNELAKNANQVKPHSIPFDKALFLPGYSDELLYKLGFIPNNAPINEVQGRYYISDIVQEISQEASFSAVLRNRLEIKE
jgi:hypothetical protein